VLQIASSKVGIDTQRIRDFIGSYVAKVRGAQKRAVAAKLNLVVQQQASSWNVAAGMGGALDFATGGNFNV